jgi:hypothetical protein
MYIIGGIDDQITSLVWGALSFSLFNFSIPSLSSWAPYQFIFLDYTHPWMSNQPIYWLFVSLFLSLTSINFYNVFVVGTLLLNLLFTRLLLKDLKYSYIYSFLFVFSTYTYLHIGIHQELLQLWPIMLFLYVLLKDGNNQKLKNLLVLGLLLSLTLLISNYLGFFLLLFFSSYILLRFFIFKDVLLKTLIIVAIVSITITTLSIFPYFESNYITGADIGSARSLHRPYEDFFTFSSRPWYYVTPAAKNPILGNIAKNTINKLENTNYFLAQNYFAGEHSASYFGLLFLLTTLVFATYIIRFANAPGPVKKQITLFLGIAFILFLFTMPPFFTVSGIKFYTPGQLVYELFPMFRVTARLSIIILLCLLIALAYSVDFLCTKSDKWAKFLRFYMPLLFIVTLLETFVPVKISKVESPPNIYTYMQAQTSEGSKFAVYPYPLTREAFFWLPVHQRLLINPREYRYGEFDSEKFTKNLNTIEGLQHLQELEADYLVVHKNILQEDLEFFLMSEKLELVSDFGDYFLYRVFH